MFCLLLFILVFIMRCNMCVNVSCTCAGESEQLKGNNLVFFALHEALRVAVLGQIVGYKEGDGKNAT